MATLQTTSARIWSLVLIGDSPGDSYWFHLMLKEANCRHRVRTYSHVLQAIPSLEQADPGEPVDLLFLDVVHRFFSLPEALQTLRALPVLSNATFIALVDGPREIDMVNAAGLKHWLQKPVDGKCLERLLAEVSVTC